MTSLRGLGVSKGRVIAPVLAYRRAARSVATELADPIVERERLLRALSLARSELAAAAEQAQRMGADLGGIFDAQRLMLDDPEWLDSIDARIARGENAEAAVIRVGEQLAMEISAVAQEYIRERDEDVLDLAGRVASHLRDEDETGLAALLPKSGRVVVAAAALTPSDTLAADPSVVAGIVTETGGANSHSAILARHLGVPAVVSAHGLLDRLSAGSLIALDGDTGEVHIDPPPDVAAAFAQVSPPSRRRSFTGEARTRDGVRVSVLANAASTEDVERAVAAGADGIGLYRTEFLFFASGDVPNEDEQVLAYSQAAAAAEPRPVVFRTLDVGGDKPPPGLPGFDEPNPFLGVRGIRYSLQHRDAFEQQVRALARVASSFGNIRVMLPMISVVEELEQVRSLIASTSKPDLSVGVMIEVPSAAVLAEELLSACDFASVGTNDLTQYLLAADRNNGDVAYLYDDLHPAVLRTLSQLASAAARARKPISVCGEMAADPAIVPLLVALGYTSLSVDSAAVADVKEAVVATSRADMQAVLGISLRATRASQVRAALGLSSAEPTEGGIA